MGGSEGEKRDGDRLLDCLSWLQDEIFLLS